MEDPGEICTAHVTHPFHVPLFPWKDLNIYVILTVVDAYERENSHTQTPSGLTSIPQKIMFFQENKPVEFFPHENFPKAPTKKNLCILN